MQNNRKKDLPASGSKDNQALRPPSDLWKRLEEERVKHVRPPDTFTAREYLAMFREMGIATHAQAVSQIERLEREGKVEMVGKFGENRERCYRLIK